jgi:hypothetical protein
MSTFTIEFGQAGIIVSILIGVSEAQRTALASTNNPVPPPLKVRGLVDTGASCTAIDPDVMAKLRIESTGEARVDTSTSGVVPYQASFTR